MAGIAESTVDYNLIAMVDIEDDNQQAWVSHGTSAPHNMGRDTGARRTSCPCCDNTCDDSSSFSILPAFLSPSLQTRERLAQ